MKNRIESSTDSINVYSKINVHASKLGLLILGLFLTAEVIFVFPSLIFGGIEPSIPTILLMFSGLYFFFVLPLKYFLWNMFGFEELIVNTKSVSWSYNYGFYKTNLKTIVYNQLATDYEAMRGEDDEEIGRLIFINYREQDNLPEVIHQTTVLISKNDIAEIDEMISDLFVDEFLNTKKFTPFSLNWNQTTNENHINHHNRIFNLSNLF